MEAEVRPRATAPRDAQPHQAGRTRLVTVPGIAGTRRVFIEHVN